MMLTTIAVLTCLDAVEPPGIRLKKPGLAGTLKID
jgi:hypothetical protein